MSIIYLICKNQMLQTMARRAKFFKGVSKVEQTFDCVYFFKGNQPPPLRNDRYFVYEILGTSIIYS